MISLLDNLFGWIKPAVELEPEETAYKDFKEEIYIGGELVPEDEILTEGAGEELPAVLPTIRKGDRGEYVTLLQDTLNKLGYDCGKADGIFGKNTQAGVKAYQKAHNLSVDGIVGKRTWTSLGLMKEPQVDWVQPPNFKQGDSRWGKKMYSEHGDKSQTMASSGCGPTSMADIVAQWWDPKITPYDLALKSLKWGTRTPNSGTSSAFFRKCQAEYKASKYQTTSSIDAAINCLNSGGYVIVCFGPGKSGKAGYQKWTKGGHYCVLWKYDGDYFYINDPASSSSSRAKGTYTEVLNTRKGFYLFWK